MIFFRETVIPLLQYLDLGIFRCLCWKTRNSEEEGEVQRVTGSDIVFIVALLKSCNSLSKTLEELQLWTLRGHRRDFIEHESFSDRGGLDGFSSAVLPLHSFFIRVVLSFPSGG